MLVANYMQQVAQEPLEALCNKAVVGISPEAVDKNPDILGLVEGSAKHNHSSICIWDGLVGEGLLKAAPGYSKKPLNQVNLHSADSSRLLVVTVPHPQPCETPKLGRSDSPACGKCGLGKCGARLATTTDFYAPTW